MIHRRRMAKLTKFIRISKVIAEHATPKDLGRDCSQAIACRRDSAIVVRHRALAVIDNRHDASARVAGFRDVSLKTTK
jgi:hypothetical protein